MEDVWEKKIESLSKVLNISKLDKEIKKLEQKMAKPRFWDDQKKAAKISKEANFIKETIEKFESLRKDLKELKELKKLAKEESAYAKASADKENWDKELIEKEKQIEKLYNQLEIQALFSSKYDKENTLLSIYAGAGGTDAQDWAEMLLRMYLRYAEKKGWKTQIIEISAGQEAGIKYVTMEIQGPLAYGHLKAEKGVHRLVRISPFDAEKMRHTSFAMVQVMPEIEEEVELEIEEKDLRLDTFKSGGHGGQGVNTTDSAVRITHIPTGIVAVCQNERSQAQNKETAMKILKSKLQHFFETEKEEEQKEIRGEFTEAAWGNQIRSYVQHPYHHVKDHRTGYTVEDVDEVLDGELDEFILEKLKK